jgi:hypothetical protein
MRPVLFTEHFQQTINLKLVELRKEESERFSKGSADNMSTVIVELIEKQIETANLDFKEGFEWTRDNRDKRFELIKDILGMANTRDGGTIILGVKDDTRDLVGVSREIWDSFDQSAVAEMVHQKSTPKVNLQVIKTEVQGKRVVALTVEEICRRSDYLHGHHNCSAKHFASDT